MDQIVLVENTDNLNYRAYSDQLVENDFYMLTCQNIGANDAVEISFKKRHEKIDIFVVLRTINFFLLEEVRF